MDIVFDKGSKDQPKGHALLYFRSSLDPEDVLATYLLVLPIAVDVSKYVPPFLMNQVGELGPKDLSAFAFPPAPERMGSYEALADLAAKRDDDMVQAGTVNPDDVAAAMMSVNEAVQQYAAMYAQHVGVPNPQLETEGEDATELGVNDVVYALMSERDRLGELASLVSRLRFAVEGSDAGLIKETEEDISLLSGHLPDNHSVPELVEAVKSTDARGANLAELYLQRCFHLVEEEYRKLTEIEAKIKDLEGGGPPD
jgi:hypothetical protein